WPRTGTQKIDQQRDTARRNDGSALTRSAPDGRIGRRSRSRLGWESRRADRHVCARSGWCEGERRPPAGDPLEFVFASRLEVQTRPGGEVNHRSGNENLVGASKSGDPARDMHGDPGDIRWSQFDLAGMQAGPKCDAVVLGGVDDRGRTMNGSGRAIE